MKADLFSMEGNGPESKSKICSAAHKYTKEKHGNCKLRASQIWINLARIKWMVAFKNLLALLWNILWIY